MSGIYVFSNFERFQMCQVYNYSIDTSKFMESQGWLLEGTYYNHLTFKKYKSSGMIAKIYCDEQITKIKMRLQNEK